MKKDCTIVLTGVTRGCGRALSNEFTQKGHTVIGCARDDKKIQELQKTFGKPHRFDAVDVRNFAEVQSWAKSVLKDHPAPDLLINNAGAMNPPLPLWKISEEDFNRVMDVNLKGVANIIRAFVPAMIEHGQGVVVNFSSGWGQSTSPHVAPYCASKWGIEGLSQALDQELPKGMSAVAFNPGVIHTDMLEECFGEAEAKHYPEPDEWAKEASRRILKLMK